MSPTHRRTHFILKRHHHHSGGMSSGLHNSAQFVSDMLIANGAESKVSVVTDNNDIDREVSQFKPDVAVIEALWVVPEKFEVLQKLHPNTQWIVRTHSEIPFLAMEGIAVDWIKRYTQYPNVTVAVNSLRAKQDIEAFSGAEVVHLPNYYPKTFHSYISSGDSDTLNIGCFGAIRPLKNQLLQAIAAMNFANQNDSRLNFYINSGRVEQGEAVLKSLRALFAGTRHTLYELDWLDRNDFLRSVWGMDLVMSVSLTETFSLVTADAVSQGVPVVTSPEVNWTWKGIQADPTDAVDIEKKIARALNYPRLTTWLNQWGLRKYSNQSQKRWLDYLGV